MLLRIEAVENKLHQQERSLTTVRPGFFYGCFPPRKPAGARRGDRKTGRSRHDKTVGRQPWSSDWGDPSPYRAECWSRRGRAPSRQQVVGEVLGNPVDGWITAGQRESGSSGVVVGGHGLGGPPLLHREEQGGLRRRGLRDIQGVEDPRAAGRKRLPVHHFLGLCFSSGPRPRRQHGLRAAPRHRHS